MSSSSQPPDDNPAYEIGYKRPPRATRFRPGHSGNPAGRPKGTKNFATVMQEGLAELVTVREGDRNREMTTMEVIVMQMIRKAMKGDARAFDAVIKTYGKGETGSTGNDDSFDVPEDISVQDAARLHAEVLSNVRRRK